MKQYLYIFLIILCSTSCNTVKQSYLSIESENWQAETLPTNLALKHSVFFVGELGSSPIETNTLKPILKKELTAANKNSTIIFLGSHLYPKGLSKKSKKSRPTEEKQLLGTFDLLENFKGNYFFISGEHDWEYKGDKGLKAIKRMEDFAEDHLDAKDFFLPENGCGDPVKVKIEDDIVVLFLNSQWWFEDWKNEKNINKGCDIKSRVEFIDNVKELIQKNKNKQLIVVMHHPAHSNGVHGGKIPAKYHFFPLTETKPKAYLPLPFFGSLAALHRNIAGSKQDLANSQYQILQEEIFKGIVDVKDIIFVGAHDQSLQYFNLDKQHYVVSGSAGNTGYARKGGNAEFLSAKQGFSKVLYYENNEVWLEFYGLDDGKLSLLYRKLLEKGKSKVEEVNASETLMTDWKKDTTVVASQFYSGKKFKKFWLGKTYRDVWELPVTVPMINLETEQGGLIPIKKGGGMQTNSLRVEDKDGNQLVFRSIMKNAESVVPEFFQNTWAQNLIQDGLSASHPYGAFVIPKLSEAANIYYTEPKLVYVPKQKGLGIYNKSFGNELYLHEDRVSGNRSDKKNFGFSEEIIGINDLLSKLNKNRVKNVIDQEWTLRSRIFDLWVHDWDRHDDQWRWATFEKDDHTLYRPIPRDRDQVFFRFDGPLYFLASTFALKNFRTFKHQLKKPQRQSFNARIFDRVFLNQMDLEDWLREAKFLQENLTNEVIEEAFKDWPTEIYNLNGDDIIEKLHSRREDIPRMAETMYKFISKKVNVLGSEDQDKFVVERLPKGKTKVTVSEISKKGKIKGEYFSRTFSKKETKEIRLYGFADDDVFEISGKSRKGSLIRIIAGSGKDKLTDDSKVGSARKRTKIYDDKGGIEYTKGKETQNRTSNRYDVNDYERDEKQYSNTFPTIILGSNFDDGFFFGGGITTSFPGFRGNPYKSNHTFNASYAPTSKARAFTFHYDLERKGTFHRLGADYIFDATLQSPTYINFYGRGNATTFNPNASKEFYFVRLIDYKVSTGLQKSWLDNRYALKVGPSFQSTKVDVINGRVSELPGIGLTTKDKERKNFVGGFLEASINTVEKEGARPVNGVEVNFKTNYLNQINSIDNFATFNGDMTYYISFFKKLQTTFATRIGAGVNVGDTPFYHANTIGGTNYLRGFRRDRFTGKYMFYQNLDLRIKLFYWQNKVLPFEFGLLGGFDYARVWEPNEASKMLHLGYSAGVWMTPFKVVSLTFNYNISKEEQLFSFGFDFFF